MKRYAYLLVAASLAAYSVCEVLAGESSKTREEACVAAPRIPSVIDDSTSVLIWKAYRERDYWMVAPPPPQWHPEVDEPLTDGHPLRFLYIIMAMKLDLLDVIKRNNGGGPHELANHEPQLLTHLVHTYVWLRKFFPFTVDGIYAFPTTAKRVLKCSSMFWDFVIEEYPSIFATDGMRSASVHTSSAPQCFGMSCLRSRRRKLRKISRCIRDAKARLECSWWSSDDLRRLLSALASVFHGSD